MSRSLRLSEKWFNRGLWIVAFAFAAFLTGLGGALVGDLPKIEVNRTIDDFIDPVLSGPSIALIQSSERARRQAAREVEQLEAQRDAAARAVASARQTFTNWLATRSVTERPDQDAELIRRTQALDLLKATEDGQQKLVDAQQQILRDLNLTIEREQHKLDELRREASVKFDADRRRTELRVFAYRLALTLPVLAIAGWLFVKKRKGTYWPFVWGFILFALLEFFVELAPYLPSYGGYVHYLVGIVITVLVGRYAIVALNRYLAQQKLAESQPDEVRREKLSYDIALTRLTKKLCPGCERPVDLEKNAIDFCPHCGIGLMVHCKACDTRKSAFAPFCHSCGAPASAST